ncbi:hypothetical protein V6U90_13435 [Micromonospora sp. CPCC 206060]|uniref:hypothetical protein n=1 Tax=Micromonospora sp. CPCC 206060 TaxID=3122406 RepID=UPI002FEEDC8D
MTGSAQLKQVGFYKSAEDVSAAAGSTQYSWEPMAVRYLEQGMTVLVSPGWVHDLLGRQAKIICQYSTLTDGKWIWPSDLVYYLRTYHVVLPDEFLAHMASHGWVVPELGEAELDAICEQLEMECGLS